MKSQHFFARSLILLGVLSFGALAAQAVEVEAVRDDTYAQLIQGELKSMALTSDGFLMPSYGRHSLGDTRNEIVWDALREKNGSVLCATGHHGKLVRLSNEKTTKTLGTMREPELTALVRLKDGSVLIAAAPTGRIYRLDTKDKLTTYTQLNAKFVWRMVPDEDGSIWAVTGTDGRLFRLRDVNGKASVEEVCKFKSANLLDLWVDREGLLGVPGDVYVAGQNPGWLYRWRPATKKIEVVYNAQAEEIRRLLPTSDGLALALNTERSPSSSALSMTLRMGGAGGSLPPLGSSPMGGGPGAPPPMDSSLSQAFSPAQQPNYGMPRSEVVLLDESGYVRSLWSAPERPIHDLALSPDKKILAAVGSSGRLFEVTMTGEYAVVVDIREDYLMRVIEDDKGYLLAAARNGVVLDMSHDRTAEAVYLSRAIDAGKLVKWGHVYWRGDLADPQQAQLSFRTGNDGDTDSDFWTPWTAPLAIKPGQAVALPAGPSRFVQYKLTLKQGDPHSKPVRMEAVDLFFMSRNGAPKVMQVTASEAPPSGGRPSFSPPPSSSSSSGDKSSGSSSLGGPPPSGPAGVQNPGGGRVARSNPMSLNITWRAVDPNDDALRYTLTFKADDETAWKLVDKNLTVTQMSLGSGGMADGRYRFRIVASDELANMPGEGLKDEDVSNEVVVDNTPPVIDNKAVAVEGNQAVITLEASDKLSLLASVKVDLDNRDEYPLLPVDGVMDQQSERFRWQTKPLRPGEHVATISITDARGNTVVDKLVFAIPQ